MDAARKPLDPTAIVRQLDVEGIRARIAEIAGERRALLVLLRAATSGRIRKSAGERKAASDAR